MIRLLKDILEEFTSSKEFLEGEAFNDPIRKFLDRTLVQFGFVNYRGLKWVERDADPIRKVFEVAFSKGATAVPCWGISINYVPHLNTLGTEMYWHRTPKTDRIDVEPVLHMDRRPLLEQFVNPSQHEKRVGQILSTSSRLAFEFYPEVENPRLLLNALKRRLQDHGPHWYWNHHNIPLAHAFTLAFCGYPIEGREILEEFFQSRTIDAKPRRKVLAAFHATNPNNGFNADADKAGAG